MKKPERLMSIAVILLAISSLLQMWERRSTERNLERQCELRTGGLLIHANLINYGLLTNGEIAQAQNVLRLQISGQLRTLVEQHGASVVSNFLGEAFPPAKAIADQVNAQPAPAGMVGNPVGGLRNPGSPREFGDTFAWQERPAVTFLEMLRTLGGGAYSVVGLHHDWVTDSDVDQLIAHLDSDAPCAFVVSTAWSGTAQGYSTVGREAAFLLEGYRSRFYPPQLSSARFEPDKAELLHWYKQWKTRK